MGLIVERLLVLHRLHGNHVTAVINNMIMSPISQLDKYNAEYGVKFDQMSEDEFSRFVAEWPPSLEIDCGKCGRVTMTKIRPWEDISKLVGDCPTCGTSKTVPWLWKKGCVS